MQESENNINKNIGYEESDGTGVISSLIFMVGVVILMVLLKCYLGI